MIGGRSLKPRVDAFEFEQVTPKEYSKSKRVIPYGDFEFEAVTPQEVSKSKRIIPYGDFEFEAVTPDEYQALQSQTQQTGDTYTPLQSFGRGFGSGLTLNWGDELLGAGSALTGGSYDETTRRLREQEQKSEQDNPIWSLLGNIAGGVTLGYGAEKALRKASSKIPYLGYLAPFLGAVIQNYPRMRNYLMAATGAGAVSGAGSADDDLGSRVVGAVKGGAQSAATGGAFLWGGSSLRSLYNKFAPESAAQKMATYIPEDKADDFINKLKGNKSEDVAGALSKSEDLRQNLFKKAETNEELNNSLREIYTEAAQRARGEMKDDVTKILNDALKKDKLDISKSAPYTMDEISKARKELADKEFGDIITDTIVDVSNDEKMKPLFEEFKEIVRKPYAQKAFQEARDLLKSSGIKASAYKVDKDTYLPSEMSMKILNEVRAKLKPDKWISPKKLEDHEWAVRGQLQDQITEIMKKINPKYTEALKNFAERSKKLDFIREGAIAFKYLTPERSGVQLQGLNITDDMMPYYKHGFASAFRDYVGNQDTLQKVDNLLKIPNVRKKINNVFGESAYTRIRESLKPKLRIESNLADLKPYEAEIKKGLWESMPYDISILGLLKRAGQAAYRAGTRDFEPARRRFETQRYQDMMNILQDQSATDLLDVLLKRQLASGIMDRLYRGSAAASPAISEFLYPPFRSPQGRP